MFDTPFALQFWPSFVSTVIGGFAISAIFFWLKEHLFSLPSLTGVWECHLVVGESAYNPYKGMELWHRIVLLQEGTKLTGRGEKYKDWAANHPVRTYDGKHRVESQITGGIEKSVTKSDVIRIHWSEFALHQLCVSFWFLVPKQLEIYQGNSIPQLESATGMRVGLA